MGTPGGMLSLWDANRGSLVFTFTGRGFSGVCLDWGSNKERCFMVNIYSPCNMEGKRKLWEDLKMSRKGFEKGLWCLIGDFNAVSRINERKGLSGQPARLEIEEFKNFIVDMDLIDPPLLGRKFTWYKNDGTAMSRLDRILLSEDWINRWRVTSQWVVRRDVSDHCPIILKMGNQEWGPKPFRFNNCWLSHPRFEKLVVDSWGKEVKEGWKAITLKEKLKALKLEIKNWNMQTYGNIDNKIIELERAIGELDVKSEEVPLSVSELKQRKDLFAELWQKLKDKESLFKQKSWQRWVAEGVANTSFFHACIKARRRKNQIAAICVDGIWVEDTKGIKHEAKNFFSQKCFLKKR